MSWPLVFEVLQKQVYYQLAWEVYLESGCYMFLWLSEHQLW